ncbi:MAG: DUF177 domain-containing protein [Rhodobiaceae bacterium]|nr:DUF177 domain-containing protein [Rhodobiaceae bacterium]
MSGEEGLPGFTYVVAREDVSDDGLEVVLKAGDAARALLVERYDLLTLDVLNAQLVIEPWRKKGLKVAGTLEAELAQSCIVTLDPVPARVTSEFTLLYLPEDVSGRRAMEVAVDPLAEEPPDPLPVEGVDLGEAVAEQLALVLDPYPRVEGAEFADAESSESGSEKKPNPFEVLKNLKTQD